MIELLLWCILLVVAWTLALLVGGYYLGGWIGVIIVGFLVLVVFGAASD